MSEAVLLGKTNEEYENNLGQGDKEQEERYVEYEEDIEKKRENEAEDDDHGEEENERSTNDVQNDYTDPWDELLEKATHDLNSSWRSR